MRKVEMTIPTNAPAEIVWTVLADFGGFLNWAGGGQGEITIESEGIGMIRHLKMGVMEMGEQLTLLDANSMQIGYKIDYGEPIGMKTYQALVTVTSTGADTCEVHWSGEFTAADPTAEDEVAAMLGGSYQGMNQGLEAYCQNIT